MYIYTSSLYVFDTQTHRHTNPPTHAPNTPCAQPCRPSPSAWTKPAHHSENSDPQYNYRTHDTTAGTFKNRKDKTKPRGAPRAWAHGFLRRRRRSRCP